MLRLTKSGLYCQAGDFYIDATGKVNKNIVTHAHADHARPGHTSYLSHGGSVCLLRSRLGKKINIESAEYGEALSINGVKVSFHPSGHIYGAAQIRVEHKGEVWVVTGDYKLEDDGLSTPFEPVKCHHFITECTFGLPVYHWPDHREVYKKINQWWTENKAAGTTSLIYGYSLGKSQRILKNIDHSVGPVFVHKTVGAMNAAIREDGADLPPAGVIDEKCNPGRLRGNLIIAPPNFASGPLFRALSPVSVAMASGWIQTGKNMGRSRPDRGFVLSDHADWPGLLQAIEASEADRVITMHGYTAELTRWLNEQGRYSIEISDLKHLPFQL